MCPPRSVKAGMVGTRKMTADEMEHFVWNKTNIFNIF